MAIRDDAYQDWKNGMKAKALSDKYGISINTTKSWITRWRKKEPQSEGAPKRVHTSNERVHPKKRGGQPGNTNAEGNKGGAPPGNQNSVKHGFYVQALSEEEQDLLDGRNGALADELKDELDLLGIRELRMMRQISAQQNNTTGLAIQSIEKKGNETTTKAIATTENIKKWEALLTQVQRTRIKGIINLQQMQDQQGLNNLKDCEESDSDDIAIYEMPKNGRDH